MSTDKNHSQPRVALVTGAAGTVGSVVVRRLIADGWRVAGVDLENSVADLSLCLDVTERAAMKKAAGQVMIGSFQIPQQAHAAEIPEPLAPVTAVVEIVAAGVQKQGEPPPARGTLAQ